MGWLEVVRAIPWAAWLSPLLLWGLLVLLCYLVMLFLINILSRQWIHNERMNFPLLKVPEMISKAVSEGETGSFFFNRFLLAGLSIPVFLHLINGLNLYYPSIPAIPTLFLAGPYFSDSGLFTGFQKLKIYIYPSFIGFAFLTSRQISFSFWFFFLGGCLLYGILNLLGYSIPASELGVTFGPTLATPRRDADDRRIWHFFPLSRLAGKAPPARCVQAVIISYKPAPRKDRNGSMCESLSGERLPVLP